MKVHGECHCGDIKFEAEVDPAGASICHCGDCQTLSGAPYRASVPAKAEAFRITHGAVKIYVKTAESGNKRAQGFCGDCGTPIYSSDAVDSPRVFNLRAGTIRQREDLIPQKQIWHDSALPWSADITGLESFPRGPA